MKRIPWGPLLVLVNVSLGGLLLQRRLARKDGPSQTGKPELALTGEVSVGPGLSWPKGAVLFVAARPADGGPPYAANKFSGPGAFKLTEEDAMIKGASLPGKLVVTARADQDGDAMTRQPGDLETSAPAETRPSGVLMLVLDKKR